MDLFVGEWRRARGLSQSALARMAGISRQTLAAIEDRATVRPHKATLQILAQALGCRLDNLQELPPGHPVQEPKQ